MREWKVVEGKDWRVEESLSREGAELREPRLVCRPTIRGRVRVRVRGRKVQADTKPFEAGTKKVSVGDGGGGEDTGRNRGERRGERLRMADGGWRDGGRG